MPPLQPAAIARRALATVLVNTVIALAITLVGNEGFAANLLYSQLIGLSIWVFIDGGRFVINRSGWPGAPAMAALVVVSVLVAYLLGSVLTNLLLGRALLVSLSHVPKATLGFVLMSLAVGGFGTFYFTSRELLARTRLAQEEAQRQASEARLRLLESQLEPHMLFNTLANLRALIGTDPERAVAMLDRLNDFLRATLKASRSEVNAGQHTLTDEFARLRDYLELMAVRMGPRLRYTLDLPDELGSQGVPPLLLQPLVENCIRHGLEPSREGGDIRVSARRGDGGLQLEVSDTGVGCQAEPAAGFGLSQVRERLATTFLGKASMDWQSQPGGGTRALLTLPLQTP